MSILPRNRHYTANFVKCSRKTSIQNYQPILYQTFYSFQVWFNYTVLCSCKIGREFSVTQYNYIISQECQTGANSAKVFRLFHYNDIISQDPQQPAFTAKNCQLWKLVKLQPQKTCILTFGVLQIRREFSVNQYNYIISQECHIVPNVSTFSL